MPPETPPPAKLRFFGTLPPAFDAALTGLGWPRFRAQQVRDWVYAKGVTNPGRMTNLSKADQNRLAEAVEFTTSTVTRRQSSEDGTQKLLLTWGDGPAAAVAETVMIPDADRRTACVSSQVGCPVGCRFCASGLDGVKENLSADQIVEQVFRLNELLEASPRPTGADSNHSPRPFASEGGGPSVQRLSGRESGRAGHTRNPNQAPPRELTSARPPRVTNIVFMGMGEPLANYRNVMAAVRLLHDPKCFNLGARRITISTVGVPSRIRDLAREDLPLNLALSLHAPNESLRRQLIPWAEHFGLDDILAACRDYFERTGREVTLEYILLRGVNDRPEHARQLSQLTHTLRANVNLIRYNEVEGLPYGRPKGEDVMAFQTVLRANGVNAHVRKSRGRDIDAACGQLRRKEGRGAGEGLVPLGAPAAG